MLQLEQKTFCKEIARLIHEHEFRKAAQSVSDSCNLKLKVGSDKPQDYLPPLQTFLHWLLNNGGRAEAAQILWTPNQFTPEPQFTKDVWKLLDTSNTGLLMGAASVTKSFSMGVGLFLEWIRDPAYTTVRCIGPTEDHLETNLFSHLVSLHRDASLPMPGKIGDLFIGLDRRNLISSIKGVVIPVGKVKKAGRLQGTKRKPRRKPHPVFGPLSRLFIFLDEIENVPDGVWSDIGNILSNKNKEGTEGLRIFGAFNPTDRTAKVGERAEPEGGWENFDVDKHYRWKSKRGWDVLRLDGEKSENVLAKREIFAGIQTVEGLDAIAKDAGGKNSAGYLTMGRGAYPSQSMEMNVIPVGIVSGARGEFIWYDKPKPLGSVDLALEGGARALYTLGHAGLAVGIKFPPSLEHPSGYTKMFKDAQGTVIPRWGVQAEQQIPLPKGDTPTMKASVMDLSRRSGVRAELLCADRTGNGAGVHDLLKQDFGAVIGVNYSQSTTDKKILEEDQFTAKEEYPRIDSELWFATKKFMEFQILLIHPQIDAAKLIQQLTQRHYTVVAGKSKVESKKDYKNRGNESPDEADSLTLLVHSARIGLNLTPSAKGGSAADESDEWWENNFPGGVRVDPSNQSDYLEGA